MNQFKISCDLCENRPKKGKLIEMVSFWGGEKIEG